MKNVNKAINEARLPQMKLSPPTSVCRYRGLLKIIFYRRIFYASVYANE